MTHDGSQSLTSFAKRGTRAKQRGGTMVLPNQLWLFDLTAWDDAVPPEAEKAETKRRRRANRAAIKPVQLSLFVPASV